MLTVKELSKFWGTLALSWLFMTAEFSLVNAIIARLPEAKFNLAAFGVTMALVMLCESPVFPAISASNALVKDAVSLQRLRRFSHTVAALMSCVLLLLAVTPLFNLVVSGLMEIETSVSQLVKPALLCMIATPIAVGYRRFYQGILVSFGKAKFVAYGTAIRLATVFGSGLLLMLAGWPGAVVGSVCFVSGMVMEAAVSRIACRRCILELKSKTSQEELSYRRIYTFYLPLALTSVILISIHPMTSFFLSHGAKSIESLAVFPVVSALVLIFKSAGIAFQEVTIAALNRSPQNAAILRRFGLVLATAVTLLLLATSISPLARIWFEWVGGLPSELLPYTSTPLMILAFLPATTIWSAFQRGFIITSGVTRYISKAGLLEVVIVLISMSTAVKGFDMIGADAAACSLLIGAVSANLYLLFVRGRMAQVEAQ
ncbi:MAG: hypothetical protein J5J00_14785 [Deltaproteobacteria bacterium]|nr:hypothetical protein [Deltaproteobacteria bacterium]